MLNALTCNLFEQHLNDTFVLCEESSAMDLQLIEVTPLTSRRPNARIPFSLLFQAPEKSPCLPQRIYPMKHPQMGHMDLFLVPIAPQIYEALFS